MACGILVPRPGIEPASSALEGGFLTTGPPGKSLQYRLLMLESCSMLNSGQSKDIKSKSQGFVNIALFRTRVFADVIKNIEIEDITLEYLGGP